VTINLSSAIELRKYRIMSESIDDAKAVEPVVGEDPAVREEHIEVTTAELIDPATAKETDNTGSTSEQESSEIGDPVSRKRSREDFEENSDELSTKASDQEKRPIAVLKRRKDPSVEETESTESKLVSEQEKKEAEEFKGEESKDDAKEQEADQDATKTLKPQPKEEEEKEKATEKIEEKKEDTEPVKSKFVFGSTTPFGANAFSTLNKATNVFNTGSASPSNTPSTPFGSSEQTKSSVFGSSSKFGEALKNAISKESIFDKEQTSEKREDSTNANNLYKQVDLKKQNVQSGEENEEQVFTSRAKLYALDLTNVKEGWKERGVGNIHVNKSLSADAKSRVIMRSNGLLKVVLNTALVSGLEVVKGMPSSLSGEKFIRITSVEDGKPIQYALKTGKVETRDSLFEAIMKLIPESV
jgi:Ran-binding protein 3